MDLRILHFELNLAFYPLKPRDKFMATNALVPEDPWMGPERAETVRPSLGDEAVDIDLAREAEGSQRQALYDEADQEQ